MVADYQSSVKKIFHSEGYWQGKLPLHWLRDWQRVANCVGSALADVLSALRDKGGFSRKDLAELSGVSDGTIKNIEYGKQHPKPETLRLLADGLATNRLRATKDRQHADELFASLMAAAGYLPADRQEAQPQAAPASLEDQLADLTGDGEVAVGLAFVGRDWRDLEEADRQMIRSAIAAARAHRRRREQQG